MVFAGILVLMGDPAWRLPSIFVGLRFAWDDVADADRRRNDRGAIRLGYMAMQAREFMQTDVIVLSILIYALLGKGADALVKFLERWRLAWHPAFQAPPNR